jgi:hypothetical protein
MVIVIDIFLSIPTMVLFIILSLNFGRSLLFLIGLFVLFGWPGLALINRTFSVQIKNYPYVEASKLMGESDFKVVLRHIIPQLRAAARGGGGDQRPAARRQRPPLHRRPLSPAGRAPVAADGVARRFGSRCGGVQG